MEEVEEEMEGRERKGSREGREGKGGRGGEGLWLRRPSRLHGPGSNFVPPPPPLPHTPHRAPLIGVCDYMQGREEIELS